MNPVGVAFVQLDHDLSMSNARIRNAPPKILTRTAKISAVYPTTVPIPPDNALNRTTYENAKNLLIKSREFLDQ